MAGFLASSYLFLLPVISFFSFSGKYNEENQGIGEDEGDIEFGSAEDEMKGTDIGLSFGAGFKPGKLRLALNYDLGLSNLSNVDDNTLKNGAFIVSVGYAIF